MFQKDMIAPCGLNCGLCASVLENDPPCPGCRGSGEGKPEFCSKICQVIHCETYLSHPDGFCDTCPQYPCGEIMEREIRYANAYPMMESPIGNLAYLRQEGIDRLLEREERRWTCACGGTICVHTGICSQCGTQYRSTQAAK